MFRIHLPRRDWNTLQIVERATIKEVLRETETWLGEIVGGEHLIIEYADFVQTAGPNYAPLNSSVSREDEMKQKPHCWGKMTWVLKYKPDEIPTEYICDCEHGSMQCLDLTRQSVNQKIHLTEKRG